MWLDKDTSTQCNTRIIYGMVVPILAVEFAGLILLWWIMDLEEKSKGLGGMVCFDAWHWGLGQHAELSKGLE